MTISVCKPGTIRNLMRYNVKAKWAGPNVRFDSKTQGH